MAPRTSRDTVNPSSPHYPLNGLDLSFEKYHHRPLASVDVAANRLLAYYLSGAGPAILDRGPASLDPEPDSPLGPYRRVLSRQDLTLHIGSARVHDLHALLLWHVSEDGGHAGRCSWSASLEETHELIREHIILAALRQHVFERSHPELRPWLSSENKLLPNSIPVLSFDDDIDEPIPRPPIPRPPTSHVSYPSGLLRSHGPMLQDARARLSHLQWLASTPPPVPDIWALPRWQLTPSERRAVSTHTPLYNPEFPATYKITSALLNTASTTLRTRRSISEPPRGSHMLLVTTGAHIQRQTPPWKLWARPVRVESKGLLRVVMAPAPRLSEVDHAIRRRSLSRRHVARMFHKPSSTAGCLACNAAAAPKEPSPAFELCIRCGSWMHPVEACRVPASGRCKCGPPPVYHTAKTCPILCSQPCGNPVPRGKKSHRSAMLCRSRCCMCGLKGHSGRECRLKKCRCGGAHLGQDCGWKPSCRVPGCGRYLCGVHCRECGGGEMPFVGWRCRACLEGKGCKGDGCEREGCELHCRECGGEGPFIGQRCGRCLENERPVGERVEEWGEKRRRRGKGKRDKAKDEANGKRQVVVSVLELEAELEAGQAE